MAFRLGKVSWKNNGNWLPAIALIISVAITNPVWSQHDPYTGPVWSNKSKADFDTSSLWYAFKNGTIGGHFRQFSMATVNRQDYPDYYALAIGGGIRYQTARFHGFQFTLSGFFIYNLSSSDLAKPDPETGVKNRYEIGLFDIEDPTNHHDLDRLEELSLSWKHKNFMVIYGKQIINTPFMNPQDGRMRPSEVSGLWMQYQPRKWKLEGGWLHNMSPRSTVRWFSVGNSIGIYPSGVNTDGSKAEYTDHLETKGIVYLSSTFAPHKNWSVQAVNQYVDNIFNTAMLQVNYQLPVGKGHLIAGAQYIRQDAINNGGNSDPHKTYFSPEQHANIFSGRVGWNNKDWQTSLNYTRISKSGRFLMPREWGREPMFTFMQRERNEGVGDVNAYVAKVTRQLASKRLSVNAAVGSFDLPSVTNYALNKYGMPSYGQANLGATYQFTGKLRGLQAELLYAYKWHRGEPALEAKYVVNKTDMSNINLIFNFQF